MKNNLLIIFASWEDRFRLGFDQDLKISATHKVLVFYFISYAERTKTERNAVEEVCKQNDIEYIEKPSCRRQASRQLANGARLG